MTVLSADKYGRLSAVGSGRFSFFGVGQTAGKCVCSVQHVTKVEGALLIGPELKRGKPSGRSGRSGR